MLFSLRRGFLVVMNGELLDERLYLCFIMIRFIVVQQVSVNKSPYSQYEKS